MSTVANEEVQAFVQQKRVDAWKYFTQTLIGLDEKVRTAHREGGKAYKDALAVAVYFNTFYGSAKYLEQERLLDKDAVSQLYGCTILYDAKKGITYFINGSEGLAVTSKPTPQRIAGRVMPERETLIIRAIQLDESGSLTKPSAEVALQIPYAGEGDPFIQFSESTSNEDEVAVLESMLRVFEHGRIA